MSLARTPLSPHCFPVRTVLVGLLLLQFPAGAWAQFKDAPAGTNRLLGLMFAAFVIGLTLIVYARVA